MMNYLQKKLLMCQASQCKANILPALVHIVICLNITKWFKIFNGYFFILGAYAPLLADGNIVVDGVLASCYAFTDHTVAHLAMKPMQWYPEIMKWIFGVKSGFPGFVSMSTDLGKKVVPFYNKN